MSKQFYYKKIVIIKLIFLFLLHGVQSCKPATPEQGKEILKKISDSRNAGGGYVSNPDYLLNPLTIATLNYRCRKLNEKANVEMTIVTVDSTGDSITDEFAKQIFMTLDLGAKDTNNGLLILLAANAGQVVIKPGYGLRNKLTDSVCTLIVKDLMTPYLQKHDYDGTILNGLAGVERQFYTGTFEYERIRK